MDDNNQGNEREFWPPKEEARRSPASPQLIRHRISQLEHERTLTSSKFKFYQSFTFAGALMVIAAIIYYLQENNQSMLFVSYCILFIALVAFCVYALRGHMHDKRINEKIRKNYGLLLREE